MELVAVAIFSFIIGGEVEYALSQAESNPTPKVVNERTTEQISQDRLIDTNIKK